MKQQNIMSRKQFILLNIFWISAAMPGFLGIYFERFGGLSKVQSKILLGILVIAIVSAAMRLELQFHKNYQSIFLNIMASYGSYGAITHLPEDGLLLAAVLAGAGVYVGGYAFIIMKKPVRKVYHVFIGEKDGRCYVRRVVDKGRSARVERRIRKQRIRCIHKCAYVMFAAAMTVMFIWWTTHDAATVILIGAIYLISRAAVWLYGGKKENWRRVFVGSIVLAMVSMSVLPPVFNAVKSRHADAADGTAGLVSEEMDTRQIMLNFHNEIPKMLGADVWKTLDKDERINVLATVMDIEMQYLGMTEMKELEVKQKALMDEMSEAAVAELLRKLYVAYQTKVIELYHSVGDTERDIKVFENIKLYDEEEDIIRCADLGMDMEAVYQKNAEVYAGKVMEVYYKAE